MFIDRVNQRLKEKNLKGSDLCKKLDIPNSNYTQWKQYVPRGTLLKHIAEELDVSIDWLMEREEAPDPEVTKLIKDFSDCDDVGKSTIISCAEFQARRCRKEIAGISDQKDEDDVLKPFA